MYKWKTLTEYWRQRFGQRVQKIPLDANSNCPNRDGTLSSSGCTFCNAIGSGSGLGLSGMSLAEQWDHWRAHFQASGKAALFLAYLQSFSNTYGSPERLRCLLEALRPLPDLVGLSVGTRPDCIDAEKAALLADMGWQETWLELGVQTFHDATLTRINRGHNAACSEKAIQIAAKAGIQVCAHLMIGLPNETLQDVLASVARLNTLPVQGVKLHNVYVCEHTALEQDYRAGRYLPLKEEEYVTMVVEALANLRPDILVHRVVADPAPGELIAPDWALRKGDLVRFIEHAYHHRMNASTTSAPQSPSAAPLPTHKRQGQHAEKANPR